MARIRTVKPELAAHEGLFDLERETGLPIRFAWTMLFTVCDREGRFTWRPRTLKAQILPHDDVDFSRVLHAWLTRGYVVKYRVGNEWFGWLPTFTRHQVINNREAPSELPNFDESDEVEDYRNQALADASATRAPRVDDACPTREVHAQAEGKGKERKEGKGRRDGTRPSKRMPDTFAVTPELRSWASANHPTVNVDRQTALMRDYEFRRPYSDWPAVWRRWIARAAESMPLVNGHAPKPSSVDDDGIPTWATAEERAELLRLRELETARADH